VAVTSPWPFVRLKLRLTVNGLRSRSWRIVVFLLGVLVGASLAVTGYTTFAVPGLLGAALPAAVLATFGGAGIVLGWLFLPLVFFGVDESLDPARFALLPLSRRTLVTGLYAASLAGIPAVATLLATLGTVDAAARLGGPAAAGAQLAGVACGLLLCAAVSRAVTSAFATALRSRRSRDLATVLLAVAAALIGPLQLAALAGARHTDWAAAARLARVLAWTPLGAPYTLGFDVAAGRAWAVPVKLAVVLLTVAGLVWWWSTTVERAMLGAAGGARRRAEPAAAGGAVRRLLLRGLPPTRAGALVSREARYWWRETRRRASLITFTVVGLFLPVMVAVTSGGAPAMLGFVGSVAAVGLVNQFGYEGSAYAAHVVAGVPARAELQSRVLGYALYGVPLFAVIATVVATVSGHPASAPALFGTLLGAFGGALAVVLPLSVRAAYALPDTANPFAVSSGGGMAKGLLSFGALFAGMLATVPLTVAAYVLGAAWPWVGLPAGVAWGLGGYLSGLHVGGRLLDRRMPELLAAVTPR
jgi:ABC-2 type transport system permease protein